MAVWNPSRNRGILIDCLGYAQPPGNFWDCWNSPQKSKLVGARLARAPGLVCVYSARHAREGGRFGFARPFHLSILVTGMLMLTI